MRRLAAACLLPCSAVAAGEAVAPSGIAMQITLLLAALTLLPAVIMSLTPFLRITLVLHFLRQALGTQSAPSSQAMTALALFLTLAVLHPQVARIHEEAWRPYWSGTAGLGQALDKAEPVVRQHLLRFVREKDAALMVELGKVAPPRGPDELPLRVLAPAYMLSELRAGFQIGAVLFLPFLVIDIVIASVTLSAGMVQLPPAMVAAPFKILLFVLVDGWNLVIGSLTRSISG